MKEICTETICITYNYSCKKKKEKCKIKMETFIKNMKVKGCNGR